MKVLISAAEASSDAHGAELLRALKARAPGGEPVEAFGIGGPRLQAEGLRAVVDARELLAMGFTEILGRLPRILSALKTLESAALSEKPALAVVIDYPDFHFRLARRLEAQGVPVVYYIPPKVWVWRRKRVELLRRFFRKVLCIFPFEEKALREAGVDAIYVGNPLIDELPLTLTRSEARTRLGVDEDAKLLVLMPGSRPSEFKRHLTLMLEGAVRAAAHLRSSGFLGPQEKLKVMMPLPVTADAEPIRARAAAFMDRGGFPILDFQISQGDSAECLVAADAALVKSGTSTLEAALLACPHAVVYKPGFLTEWIFKLFIRYRGPVGLVNLVNGWKPGDRYLAHEILMDQMTPERLAEECVSLFTDQERRRRMVSDFHALRDSLGWSLAIRRGSAAGGPSDTAALEICKLAEAARGST